MRAAAITTGYPRAQALEAHGYSRERLFRRWGPAFGISIVAVLHLARLDAPGATGLVIGVAGLCAATVALTWLLPWERLPRAFQVLPPLILLTAAFMIRAATGGASSPFAELPILPMVWLAAYGTRGELAAGLIGLVLVQVAPASPAEGADPGLGQTLLLAGAGAGLAFSLNAAVSRLRHTPAAIRVRVESPALDRLTGLPNRAMWETQLDSALPRLRGTPVCLAVLDVDSFLWFNDRNGRKAGDLVLRDFGAALRRGLRTGDAVGRVGGDRFAVLLTRCTVPAAHAVVRRLCRATPRGLTCCSGIAMWDGNEPAAGLMGRAEGALRQAKLAGPDRVVVSEHPPGLGGPSLLPEVVRIVEPSERTPTDWLEARLSEDWDWAPPPQP